MFYRRLTAGLNDRGILIQTDKDALDYIKDDKDHYLGTYKYTEQQKQIFEDTGTIAGITDVMSDKIWWDFDSEHEPELARQSTVLLVDRLIKKGISQKDIVIAFSGNKGFGVELNLTDDFSPKDIKTAAFDLAHDLPHFDVKMYNASRILRILTTKHQKTGLYKIPLTYFELTELSVDEIMYKARELPSESEEFRWNAVNLISKSNKTEVEPSVYEILEAPSTLDYSAKPRFLTNCRWAIQNGHFKEGDRSTALLCLGSTYKNLGFDLEHVYRLLKGTAELQARLTHSERFSDEEIYNNIIIQVFGPNWNNGQYTCREPGNWLHFFCSKLDCPCNHKIEDELKPKLFSDLKSDFKHYVKHIEKNTIHTGLPSIDQNVFLSTGANVLIVGSPGSGKTSLGLEILNRTSKAGVRSVVASLDMAQNRIFEKLLYRLTGYDRTQLYQIFKDDKEAPLMKQLQEEFGNVNFFKKSCPAVQDIRDYITRCNEQGPDRVKLVVIDYFERIVSDMGDDTAASKRIAGELQDLVDDFDICLITLVQPNKNALSGGPDLPIYDYTKIKGSSFVYQAARIIMSCWRPFYTPKNFHNDKYMQVAILKNDLGELNEFSFNWNGKRGVVTEMEDFQRSEFEEMLRKKMEEKNGNQELNFH